MIPITGPSITEKEVEWVAEAVRDGWYTNARKYTSRFEAAFAEYVGRPHALALSTCTSALHLSLVGTGIGPGDEVIVPESTWIGTAAPITYVGATPIFADIDPRSWCIDVESVRSKIAPRTKAIVFVDLYGAVPDVDALLALAAEYGLPVIEDAAQGVGAEYKGRRAGSFGLASAFSFGPTKTLTTGEGGILLSDDEQFVERCRYLSGGAHEPGTFWNTEVAFKYAMTNMQAALGLAQLDRVAELVEMKQTIFGWYAERLAGTDGLELNPTPADVRNGYWMVTIVPDETYDVVKQDLISALRADDISTRPFFHPMSSLPAYRHLPSAQTAPRENPVAYRLGKTGINLPSGFDMTEEKVDRVCRSVHAALARSRRLIAVRH